MIELSRRLQMNADLVPEGAGVADIGCDHGYVSIYLAEQKKCRCIAMDVRPGPLAAAKKNISQYGMEEKIICRLSDGLEQLQPGEVDTLLIGGMGGMLMSRILQQNPAVIKKINNLILQPQSDRGEVRRQIYRGGFFIEREACTVDDGKFYLAILAKRGEEFVPYSETEYEYGRDLVKRRDVCYFTFLRREAAKCERICDELRRKDTDSAGSRVQELTHTIKQIREITGMKGRESDADYIGE